MNSTQIKIRSNCANDNQRGGIIIPPIYEPTFLFILVLVPIILYSTVIFQKSDEVRIGSSEAPLIPLFSDIACVTFSLSLSPKPPFPFGLIKPSGGREDLHLLYSSSSVSGAADSSSSSFASQMLLDPTHFRPSSR